eukprot:361808-Chlamydomonas_euryale.AAC.28
METHVCAHLRPSPLPCDPPTLVNNAAALQPLASPAPSFPPKGFRVYPKLSTLNSKRVLVPAVPPRAHRGRAAPSHLPGIRPQAAGGRRAHGTHVCRAAPGRRLGPAHRRHGPQLQAPAGRVQLLAAAGVAAGAGRPAAGAAPTAGGLLCRRARQLRVQGRGGPPARARAHNGSVR